MKNKIKKDISFTLLFFSLGLFFFNANAGQDGLVINGVCKTKGCPLESQQKKYALGFGDFYIVEDDKQVSSVCPSCNNEVQLESYSFENCLYALGKQCDRAYEYAINDEKVHNNQNSWYNLKCSVRKIKDGLNVLGTCSNSECSSSGKGIVVPKGEGSFKLVENEKDVPVDCPYCESGKLNIEKYFFKNCLYTLTNYEPKLADERGEFFDKQDRYITLNSSVVSNKKLCLGLNLFGECKSHGCHEEKKPKIIPVGMGGRYLVKNDHVLSENCSKCKNELNINGYFFKDCIYKVAKSEEISTENNVQSGFNNQDGYITLEVSARPLDHLQNPIDVKTPIKKEISGIPNMGNSCYINALAALLSYYPLFDMEDFRDFDLKRSNSANFSVKWLKKLELLKANTSREVARSFARFAGYIPGEQDDPITLIEKMHIPDRNIITLQNLSRKNYDGDLPEKERKPLDTFIKRKKLSYIPYVTLDMTNDQGASLQDKLLSFLSIHQNQQEDENFIFFEKLMFYSKKGVESLPDVFFIQLKRYKVDYSFGETFEIISTKLKDSVIPDDEISLDFKNGMANSKDNNIIHTRYQLVGIIIHLGESTNRGHYIARIKHHGGWYIHNDKTVMDEDSYFSIFDKYSKDELINKNGYMFMYKLIK